MLGKQDCDELLLVEKWSDKPHQTFTVQEGRAPIPGCGPFGEIDDMIQVSG